MNGSPNVLSITGFFIFTGVVILAATNLSAQNIVAPQAAQAQIIAVDGTPVTITGAGAVQMGAAGDAIVLTTNAGGAGVTVTLDAGTQLVTAAGASGIGININTGTVTNNGTITTNGVGSSQGITIVTATADITNSATGVITTNAAGGGANSDGIRLDVGNVINLGNITTSDATSAAIIIDPNGNGTAGGNITNSLNVTTNGAGSPALANNTAGDITNTATGVITTNGGTAVATSDGIFFGSGNGDTGTNAGTININGFGSGFNVGGSGDIVNNSGTINLNGATNAQQAGILSSANGGNTITNLAAGTININAAAAAANGISVTTGDKVTNAGTINIAAGGFGFGINAAGTGSSITNSGTINYSGFLGGILSAGGSTITNTAAGTITMNGGAGAILTNGNDTVNNAGTITINAAGINGIVTGGGGNTVNNSGTINAAGFGAGIASSGGDTVTNSGTINMGAISSHAISITAAVTPPSTITNAAGGTINMAVGGNSNAINSAGGGNNLINAGTINMNGNGNAIVTGAGGDTITNSGTINMNGNGTSLSTAAGDIFTNTGIINVAGTGNGIISNGNATVNSTGGSINMNNAGGAHAINVIGGGNTVTAGNVTMTGAGNVINSAGGNNLSTAGNILLNGGTVFNTSAAAADTVSNSGTITITAANPGTVITLNGGQAHTFTNSGTIADSNTGAAVGIVTGAVGSTINNSGTITDTAGGATGLADGIVSGGATVTNSGAITLDGGGFGIFSSAAGGPITNSGTITTTGGGSFGMTDNSGNTINHTGTITTSGAAAHGIAVNPALASTINVSGTINATGPGSSAIFSFTNFARTLNLNAATLSSGSAQVIQLGNANDVINLQGRVNITGIVDGGGGGLDVDTMNLSNMRLSQALINQLQAATTAPTGTAQLFGSTLSWNDIEFINLDLGSIVSYSSLLTSPETRSFGAALDSISTFNDADLVAFLNAFDAIPVADLEAAAINVIGQDTLQSFSNTGIATATQFTNAFMRRLPAFIGSGSTLGGSNFTLLDASLDPLLASTSQHLAYNSPSLAISDSSSLGLATSAASTATGRLNYQELYPQAKARQQPENRFVAEVIGSGTVANQDATSDRPKSNYFVTTATLRGGYRINKDATVGAYAGYNGGEAETDAFGSELEYQGGHAGIFGQYAYQGFRFVGLAGYTYTNYDSDRRIAIPGINRTAESETDSNQVLVAGEIAYDFILGPNHQWKVTPIIGLQYTHMWIDGYQESGAGALSLNVGDQDVDSLQTKVGVELSKIWQYNDVSHVTFFANGFWHHEILDNNRTVNAAFNSNAINSFTVQTEDPERDFAIVGVGLDAVPFRNQDVHLLLGYQNQFGQDGYISHTLYGGYRRDF